MPMKIIYSMGHFYALTNIPYGKIEENVLDQLSWRE